MQQVRLEQRLCQSREEGESGELRLQDDLLQDTQVLVVVSVQRMQ